MKILITLLFPPSRVLESYGELKKSYGKPWVEKCILHLNMIRQELWRATESYGSYREQCFYILIIFELDHSGDMKSYGDSRRATKSYGEPWVEKFILHLNMNRHKLQRATKSYGELRRAI